jgi:hypothetical protein
LTLPADLNVTKEFIPSLLDFLSDHPEITTLTIVGNRSTHNATVSVASGSTAINDEGPTLYELDEIGFTLEAFAGMTG